MQLPATIEGFFQVHFQTIGLNDTDIQRAVGINHRAIGIEKQPLRRRGANMHTRIGGCVLQRTNDLIRAHCMAVTMTGNVVKN